MNINIIKIIVFFGYISTSCYGQNWTHLSKEQIEYNNLSQQCNQIAEYFTAMGGGHSSAYSTAIFDYLKKVGTPTSLEVLKSQVSAGRVPANYLNNI